MLRAIQSSLERTPQASRQRDATKGWVGRMSWGAICGTSIGAWICQSALEGTAMGTCAKIFDPRNESLFCLDAAIEAFSHIDIDSSNTAQAIRKEDQCKRAIDSADGQ